MADFSSLPLFTDAYLADTTHLADAEHGIYLQLLVHTWRTPGCRLPNDPDWIARKMRRNVENFEQTVRPLLQEFFNCDGNWWRQKRLTKEFLYIKKKRKNQSARAKSRWDKEKDQSQDDAAPHNAGTCQPDAAPHCPGDAPSPSPSPSPTKKELPPLPDGSSPPRDMKAELLKMPPSLDSKPKSNGSRLPEDWELPADWEQWAAAEGHPDPQREALNFRDHWLGKAGKDGRKANWKATWRNWVRRSFDFNEKRSNGEVPTGRVKQPPNDPEFDRRRAELKGVE